MNIFLENIYNLSFFFNTGFGIFSFVCIYILIVLLILPASWLSLLSGFLYGSYLGSIIVFISASIGASVAFFVSKSFFAKKLIFPFSILNYFYGLNNVKFRDFALGLLGIIPGTFLYCSIGSLAKSIQDLKNVQSPNNLYMTILGIISTLLVVYFSAKYSKIAPDSKMASGSPPPSGS